MGSKLFNDMPIQRPGQQRRGVEVTHAEGSPVGAAAGVVGDGAQQQGPKRLHTAGLSQLQQPLAQQQDHQQIPQYRQYSRGAVASSTTSAHIVGVKFADLGLSQNTMR